MPEKWTFLISIPSDTSRGTSYGIDVNADGSMLRCKCASFIHSTDTPKWCKHLDRVEVGRALNAFVAKLRPKPSGLRVIATTHHMGHRSDGSYHEAEYLGYSRVPEPVVIVTLRELKQGNAIIEEAWRYASPHSKLKELLDNLGRP